MIPAPTRPLGFGEFVAMMAVLFASIAFSIDAMLPGIPAIGMELTPEAPNQAQLIVTFFMLGMGIGILFAGPLSDQVGRRPLMVLGVGIYVLGALFCLIAPSLEWMLAARMLMGLGAAGPRTVSIAMMRDLYAGRDMARVMSFVMTIFILIPAIAPSLGAGIMWLAGWRAIFLAFILFGLVSGGWFLLRQPETLPVDKRRILTLTSFRTTLVEILGNRAVLLYIFALSFGFGQMFAFLSTAPQLFHEAFDRADSFPFWFALVALFAAMASITNAKLVMRLGMQKLASFAYLSQAILSLLALGLIFILNLQGDAQFIVFMGYMSVMFFMIGLTFGNLNALAMEPLGHIAGFAAAVIGALSTVLAVAFAIPVGLLYDGTPIPLITSVVIASTLAFGLVVWAGRVRMKVGA